MSKGPYPCAGTDDACDAFVGIRGARCRRCVAEAAPMPSVADRPSAAWDEGWTKGYAEGRRERQEASGLGVGSVDCQVSAATPPADREKSATNQDAYSLGWNACLEALRLTGWIPRIAAGPSSGEACCSLFELGGGHDPLCLAEDDSELDPLAARIAKGRAKYPTGCTVLSLLDEAGEVAHAVNKRESHERVRDELLDVAAVAMRLYHGEIDTEWQPASPFTSPALEKKT